MQRSNLETVILMCKKLGFDSPKNLLCDALDRPLNSGIDRAVATLREASKSERNRFKVQLR